MLYLCMCILRKIKYVHIQSALTGNVMLYVGLAAAVTVLLFLLAVFVLIFCRKRSSRAKGEVTGCAHTHTAETFHLSEKKI